LVKRLIVLFLILLCLACFSSFLNAGDWHNASQLACTDCHTMHNSQRGQTMRYDKQPSPSPRLLRHATGLSLCVYCHDGGNPNAPDVISPVTYASDPAGGFFANSVGQPPDFGHKLGIPLPAPGSPDLEMTLTCASCHDVHGNSNYRNLLLNPPGSGSTGNLTVVVNQTNKANGTNRAQVYVPANLRYKSGMAEWCKSCHPDFHGKSEGAEGTQSPWLRHPQGKQISGSNNVDFTSWSGTVANRVPVQTPMDDVIPSSDDQVFCLSCHKAHGSAKRASLIFVDGVTLNSTCQQCHNQ